MDYTDVIGIFNNIQNAAGVVSQPTQSVPGVVITTSTSVMIGVAQREFVSAQFKATGISSGNCVFTCQITNVLNPVEADWTTYNRLVTNITNTNVQNDVRVASVTLSANGTAYVFFPQQDSFVNIRFIATVTTDGNYSGTFFAQS